MTSVQQGIYPSNFIFYGLKEGAWGLKFFSVAVELVKMGGLIPKYLQFGGPLSIFILSVNNHLAVHLWVTQCKQVDYFSAVQFLILFVLTFFGQQIELINQSLIMAVFSILQLQGKLPFPLFPFHNTTGCQKREIRSASFIAIV